MQTISSQPINIPTQTAVDKDDNENDDSDDDEGKLHFTLRLESLNTFKICSLENNE